MKFLNDLLPQRRLQALRAQLDERGTLVNQLEGQLAELRRNMIELSNRHRETLDLINDLENDLEAAHCRHEALEADTRAQRALLERESAALRNKDEELDKERKERARNESDMRAAHERVQIELSAKTEHAHALDVSLQQLQAELASERRTRKDREADLQTLRESLERRGAENAELERRIDDLVRQQGELTEGLRAVSTQLDASSKAGRISNDAIVRLEGTLQQERAARSQLEEQFRSKIENLIARRDEVKNAVQNTASELERARAALDLTKAALANERTLRKTERESAAARIQSAEQSRQDAKQLLRETQDALAAERAAHAALRAAFDRQTAKMGQLSRELAHNPMRTRLAAMEEALHIHIGRALDMAEPLAEGDFRDIGAAQRLRQAALDKARQAGGVLVTRAPESAGSASMTPEQFAALRKNRPTAWAIVSDDEAEQGPFINAAAPGAHVLSIGNAALRASSGFACDPGVDLPELTADCLPKRVVVIVSEDDTISACAADLVADLVAGRSLPRLPSVLVAEDWFDADAWLAAALAAADNPKIGVLRLNADALSALSRQVESGRAQAFTQLLQRARVLMLAWSDKALGVSQRQRFGAGKESGALDAGDARMSVPIYRKMVRADQRLNDAIARGGFFRRTDIVKSYVELTDAYALVAFCRDGGFALKPARAEEARDLFDPGDDQRTLEFAKLIRNEVEAQASRATGADLGELKGLARAQERAGRYADALNSYAEAVRAAPTDFEARAASANYLELSGQEVAAERTLREALRSPDTLELAADSLRQHYRRTGDDRRAYAAARLLQRAGASKGALAVATAAIAIGKTNVARRALTSMAGTPRHGKARQRAELLVTLRERLDMLRGDAERGGAEQWFALGEALRQLDEVADAAQAYARAETSAPGFISRMCGPDIGPDLLLIGPPRTGTTLLRKVLELSQTVALLDGESSFLTNVWPVTLPSFVDEIGRARAAKGAMLVGDKSPLHFTLDDAHVALAAQLFPHARIIVTLREPIERAWSQIKLFGHRRVVDASIAAALGGGKLPRWLEDTIENSRYLKHLKTWAQHFGAERILLLQSEDFERDIQASCARLFAWLKIKAPDEVDIERLQQNWSNRTANYARQIELGRVLEEACGGEIFTVRELEAALLAEQRSRNRSP